MSAATVLVTGGCGFLGEEVLRVFRDEGHAVRSFDKAPPEYRLEDVDYRTGDIRDRSALRSALDGIGIVIHAVAAVPLARSATEFREINVDGTLTTLELSEAAGVRRFVYISSSAVYGIPARNPVSEEDERLPLEEYGRAKLDAEELSFAFARDHALEVAVVRPRTILGPGRLGIFGILFDWVADGASVPVIGAGDNVYQFVHVTDLADAIRQVALAPLADTFNIGGSAPSTMRDALDALCRHAGTRARTFRLSRRLFRVLATTTSRLRLSPLAPYHWLLYGETLYFDGAKAQKALGWTPQFSSTQALLASYDSYVHRDPDAEGGVASPHRSVPKQGLLRVMRGVSRLLFSARREAE